MDEETRAERPSQCFKFTHVFGCRTGIRAQEICSRVCNLHYSSGSLSFGAISPFVFRIVLETSESAELTTQHYSDEGVCGCPSVQV